MDWFLYDRHLRHEDKRKELKTNATLYCMISQQMNQGLSFDVPEKIFLTKIFSLPLVVYDKYMACQGKKIKSFVI